MNKLNKALATAGIALTIGLSGVAYATDAKVVEAIKLEVRQHTGVTGSYDPETQIVTLSGFVEDMATFGELVSRIKKLDHVKGVRSSVFHD